MNTVILMPSVTHAMNARRLLTARGYKCELKRTVRSAENGCSYYVLINTDPETAVALLDSFSVPHGMVMKEAVSS